MIRYFQPVAAGLLSILAILAFSYLGTLTPQSRIDDVVRRANADGLLAQLSNVHNDLFTECAIFDMELTRNPAPLKDVFGSTWYLPPPNQHPCDVIRAHLAGLGLDADPALIIRYHYGARHLFAVLARFMDLSAIRSLIAFVSLLAPLALGTAFLIRQRLQAIEISPLVLILFIGFNYSNMGDNVAHAPGFALPLLALAGVVLFREFFLPVPRRFAAYAAIAVVTTYFDILTGALPFTLAMLVIVNQFCFNSGAEDSEWLKQSIAIVIVFLAAYAVAIGLRLAVAAVVFGTNPVGEFVSALSLRMSLESESHPITRWEVFERLWQSRRISFSGASTAATIFYLTGFASWIVSLVMLARTPQRWRDIAVLAGASFSIIAWYLTFVNHTFVHYQFMGRIGVLPAACGIVALAVMSKRRLRFIALAAVPAVGLFASIEGGFPKINVIEPVFVDTNVDVVSCSNEPVVKSDGIRDNVISVTVESPPFMNTHLSSLTLFRSHPDGQFATKVGSFPLAVLDRDGALLSTEDRSRRLSVSVSGRTTLLLAFCDDGVAGPAAQYGLRIESMFANWAGPLSLQLPSRNDGS
jgi:hypothetical protein